MGLGEGVSQAVFGPIFVPVLARSSLLAEPRDPSAAPVSDHAWSGRFVQTLTDAGVAIIVATLALVRQILLNHRITIKSGTLASSLVVKGWVVGFEIPGAN